MIHRFEYKNTLSMETCTSSAFLKLSASVLQYIAGDTKYMVKANGKLQPYWMSMVRTWLESLDNALEKELKAGNLDLVTGKPVKGKVCCLVAIVGIS